MRVVFAIPSMEKNDLKIMAEETKLVAHGRKMRVLNMPLPLSLGSLRIEARINANVSMTGTWITR